MRILIIAGAAESLINFRANLLGDLVARGHEVHAAAPSLGSVKGTDFALQSLGVEPHAVRLNRTGMNPVRELASLWQLYRLMRRLRPDMVLGYTIKPVIWGTLAAWAVGVPKRHTLITGLGYAFAEAPSRSHWMLNWVASILYRTALRRADTIIFQNPDDAQLFADRNITAPGSRVTVVSGSGVDLTLYPPTPFPDGPMRFVLLARMLGAKGVREYAEAARRVRERHPEVQFDLVGGVDSNPDRVAEAEIAAWQEETVLKWHGQVDDVRPLVAAAHVCVLPSYYREGIPRSLLEAMAMGRILITTDAPGCRETVRQGCNGYLVPTRNAKALEEAMLQVVALSIAEKKEMSSASVALARERFDVDLVTSATISAIGA